MYLISSCVGSLNYITAKNVGCVCTVITTDNVSLIFKCFPVLFCRQIGKPTKLIEDLKTLAAKFEKCAQQLKEEEKDMPEVFIIHDVQS